MFYEGGQLIGHFNPDARWRRCGSIAFWSLIATRFSVGPRKKRKSVLGSAASGTQTRFGAIERKRVFGTTRIGNPFSFSVQPKLHACNPLSIRGKDSLLLWYQVGLITQKNFKTDRSWLLPLPSNLLQQQYFGNSSLFQNIKISLADHDSRQFPPLITPRSSPSVARTTTATPSAHTRHTSFATTPQRTLQYTLSVSLTCKQP